MHQQIGFAAVSMVDDLFEFRLFVPHSNEQLIALDPSHASEILTPRTCSISFKSTSESSSLGVAGFAAASGSEGVAFDSLSAGFSATTLGQYKLVQCPGSAFGKVISTLVPSICADALDVSMILNDSQWEEKGIIEMSLFFHCYRHRCLEAESSQTSPRTNEPTTTLMVDHCCFVRIYAYSLNIGTYTAQFQIQFEFGIILLWKY